MSDNNQPFDRKIFVTQPFLPDLEEFLPYLQRIWQSKHLTNFGPFHVQFEQELTRFLNVPYASLFTNGTLALITSLQALKLTGKVLTTPFTFAATTHSLWWNKPTPVFVDIDPRTGNIDPDLIEDAITPDTSAILAVHVYGNPCDNEKLTALAGKHGLRLIYDAAQAFNVKKNAQSILTWGDVSIVSFHATKCFSTFEGGAVFQNTAELKYKIDKLKNFGFADEVTIVAPGQNSKMTEFQAAMGVFMLNYIEHIIAKRKSLYHIYKDGLSGVQGISFFGEDKEVGYNYTYCPILIDAERFGMSRDDLYLKLKEYNIYTRRYFYPLISDISIYRDLPSAEPENLPAAHSISGAVLCLPLYPDLTPETVHRITGIVRALSVHK